MNVPDDECTSAPTSDVQCGYPLRPRLRLELPAGTQVAAIVWRDNLNRTVALNTTEVELPPLAQLVEASMPGGEACNTDCDWRYHVSQSLLLPK